MDLQEISKLYDFTGRTILITGGAGVLGGEMACALAGCGANVVILDRDPIMAKSVIQRIPAGTGRSLAVTTDVLDQEMLNKAAEEVLKEFGRVDGLINTAGGNKPEATTAPDRSFFTMPKEALQAVVDLNLMGTILPCQVFGAQMAKQGEGVILNISSMTAFRPLTRVLAYSAAKAGLSNFTQWLAVYMAQEYSSRIRVNAIAPGFFLTEQNRYLLTDPKTGELTTRGQSILAHTPMQRFGKPEDLLGVVLWLLSPASAFVTGIVVPIDGGFSAYSGV
jgi:NAD(P)-dependent dehydrogenase (short-subunit alcohol dehydrogenase family)